MRQWRYEAKWYTGHGSFDLETIVRTEEEILKEYWDRWVYEKVKLGWLISMISQDQCILDWVRTHDAEEILPGERNG
jgi:hypothetical protein